MKPNPHRTFGARLLMSVVLNCWSPLLANVPQHDGAQQRTGRTGQSAWHETAAPPASGHCVHERLTIFNDREPRFIRARACLLTFLQQGCDSQLLDYWLNELADDTIIEGMPGELVVAFYGGPLDRRSITFDGQPAEMWSIVRRPDRADTLIVSGGKVVRVGA